MRKSKARSEKRDRREMVYLHSKYSNAFVCSDTGRYVNHKTSRMPDSMHYFDCIRVVVVVVSALITMALQNSSERNVTTSAHVYFIRTEWNERTCKFKTIRTRLFTRKYLLRRKHTHARNTHTQQNDWSNFGSRAHFIIKANVCCLIFLCGPCSGELF